MSESRGMRGITHQMEAGGKRLIVTVCHACEGADPRARGDSTLGVPRGDA